MVNLAQGRVHGKIKARGDKPGLSSTWVRSRKRAHRERLARGPLVAGWMDDAVG